MRVGEASVVAAVSSPHRREGQLALACLLDGLKANVPVWKKVREDFLNNPTPLKYPAPLRWTHLALRRLAFPAGSVRGPQSQLERECRMCLGQLPWKP